MTELAIGPIWAAFKRKFWKVTQILMAIFVWLWVLSGIVVIWAFFSGNFGHKAMSLSENIAEGCIQNLPQYACPALDPSGKADRLPPPPP